MDGPYPRDLLLARLVHVSPSSGIDRRSVRARPRAEDQPSDRGDGTVAGAREGLSLVRAVRGASVHTARWAECQRTPSVVARASGRSRGGESWVMVARL
jgi:hypothetical protein